MQKIRLYIWCLGLFLFGVSPILAQSNDELRKNFEGLYEKFNSAILAEDVKVLGKFYDGKFTLLVGEDVLDKEEVMAIWAGQFEALQYVASKITIEEVSAGTKGRVNVKTKWAYKATQLTDEGKKSKIEIINTATDVWIKNAAGEWVIVSHESLGSEGTIDGKSLTGNK